MNLLYGLRRSYNSALQLARFSAILCKSFVGLFIMCKEVDKLLANVNKEMYELTSEEGFFATMVLSKYWPRSGRVQTTRAGHPYPLWAINHGLRKLPRIDGFPIGV
jgi:serine phosphatase RsbU (regulator of sigma subunit)